MSAALWLRYWMDEKYSHPAPVEPDAKQVAAEAATADFELDEHLSE
ncbi:MAG: hypothetical protein JWM37_92 [Candidatus Saccharibacteria bacterium]|nr:hypothetical protein [Candidatus Saccharibacteria bacterium]